MTCFLPRQGGGADRVLVARRSDRVGDCRGRRAAISGFVETTPAAQALVEIEEETGLSPTAVRTVRTGMPLVVEDAALAAVYPPLEPVAAAGGSNQRP